MIEKIDYVQGGAQICAKINEIVDAVNDSQKPRPTEAVRDSISDACVTAAHIFSSGPTAAKIAPNGINTFFQKEPEMKLYLVTTAYGDSDYNQAFLYIENTKTSALGYREKLRELSAKRTCKSEHSSLVNLIVDESSYQFKEIKYLDGYRIRLEKMD